LTDTPHTPPRRNLPTPDLVLTSLLGEGAENAEIGLFVYDDDGRYVSVNRYGADLLGHDRTELLTRDVADFTEGGIDRSVLLRRERREGVRIVHRKDGSQVPVAFVVTPTQVSSLWFYLAVVWELPADDPRAADAF
jgi:PAS domain S-box-containing protein